MSRVYDNWERLVAAVLREQQLWQLFHEQSRSPSIFSEASSSNSSSFRDVDFSNLESSSIYWHQLEEAVANSHKLHPKLVFISDFSPAFDVEDVLLVSAELLGSGTFGSVYIAVMVNGVRIVVKRLNLGSISEQEFKRHMDIVGSVRHENVAPLRAYYSSRYEKLMLYDYHSNRSMYALLHGRTGVNRAHVDWETRLRIALGAARGIAVIHSRNGGELVHGNIKSSNIFLNPQHYGCVSDLGLTNIIETTFMPTARCYAPEVKSTQNVSQESDVYSFGIFLLELLTRKSPVHVNLVKLVNSINSKVRTSTVFDADLLKFPAIREQMNLGKMNIGNSVCLERKLVFVEEGNVTFEYEYMLKASAEDLVRGTFGSSCKAVLNGDITITVKRLKDVNVTFQEFQQNMEAIGRMRHENESASAMLHGTDRTLMYWETRLQIAIVAKVSRPVRRSAMPTTGYLALELKDTKKVSQASDVYIFGVVLLEPVTGKPSQHTTEDGEDYHETIEHVLQIAMDCVNFVHENRPKINKVLKILVEIRGIDTWGPPSIESRIEYLLEDLLPMLTLAAGQRKMSRIYDNWERLVAAVLRKQQLWQLFHEHSRSPSICSEASSSNSSFFHDVPFDFSSLESSSTYWQQLEDAVDNSQKMLPKLVLFSDFSPAFDVEEVFLASAELLGRGTFGSVHTAVMDNGLRIAVRRLNSLSISVHKFKRHMDIVANVRHKNVTPLRAYYYSKDERLMLYDYYSNRSMYALLHGMLNSVIQL
ncbi:hypothetical protein BUALT_Bualt06G0130200 [Buddleja alternifolia]|uniref:Protein kinase domain-containing protein n=1 Tax=Buddleja alternifolia TaxID=168488 RepID=A0AAV6XG79_9LAMI|nr:hypothetical protein BUALT_Bualt06G0130200 [Buddleja alternifolia]